jgi:predicted  nucleic acid-binding Zn-ribbon protein
MDPATIASLVSGGIGAATNLAMLPSQMEAYKQQLAAAKYNIQNSQQETNMKTNEQLAAEARLRNIQQGFAVKQPQSTNWAASPAASTGNGVKPASSTNYLGV